MSNSIRWPAGKSFAFTILDDTDSATLDNVAGVYSLLTDFGFRTTKSVWPLEGRIEELWNGSTCEDPEYLRWIYTLKNKGFEIGYHNATVHSSMRDETIAGIEKFRELFGAYPKTMANHSGCDEALYWGNARVSGFNRIIYDLYTRRRNRNRYRGHVEGDKYYWGDICRDKIKYVRNFVFGDINTLKACPFMPYHDPDRPLVNYWFASSEGPLVESFNQCISESRQDRLEEEGGACIMYTHLSSGFLREGRIDSRFQFLMERLSKKNGWFVPVSELLDFLLEVNGRHIITGSERWHLENRWLLHKMRVGMS
jgi:hypothetical protein